MDLPAQRLVMLVAVALFPSALYGQGSITGTVRDTSGAVLPGVTVEASSPALIEKVRSGVTDGTGQYRIIDLRPGTYTVTFTLTGFAPVKREGIELAGTFTATVNGDLQVGTIKTRSGNTWNTTSWECAADSIRAAILASVRAARLRLST